MMIKSGSALIEEQEQIKQDIEAYTMKIKQEALEIFEKEERRQMIAYINSTYHKKREKYGDAFDIVPSLLIPVFSNIEYQKNGHVKKIIVDPEIIKREMIKEDVKYRKGLISLQLWIYGIEEYHLYVDQKMFKRMEQDSYLQEIIKRIKIKIIIFLDEASKLNNIHFYSKRELYKKISDTLSDIKKLNDYMILNYEFTIEVTPLVYSKTIKNVRRKY